MSPLLVTLIVVGYMAALWSIAVFGERRSPLARKLADSGFVYALSIAVYCTSWTFYGSVGKAASGGLAFLPVYLGPTIACFFAWPVLSRLAELKERHRITSTADFVSARFHRSQALGALVAAVVLVGALPYIALQLKAVTGSFTLLVGESAGPGSAVRASVVGPVLVAALAFLTVLFGVRKLDPTERHRGMVLALSVECLVKLVAFLAAGAFVTWGLFSGPGEIWDRLVQHCTATSTGPPANPTPTAWFTSMLLSASAILFLPRQFHVAVVENSDRRHVRTAQWFVPLYLLAINLFVIPIAWGGLALGHPASSADDFVLRLPLEAGHHGLALLVFVGGFSASAGMVMICSVAVSTMVSNHLLLPVIDRVKVLAPLRGRLLQVRWAVVVASLALGYAFAVTVGESYMLVNMGMISFAAALQFAPAVILGLFWRRASRAGALLGVGTGAVLWLYTLFLPAVARSGWLPDAFLRDGLFGIGLLRPEALFGLTGLDKLTHAVFWTMLCNVGGLVLGTALWPQGDRERAAASDFLRRADEPTGTAEIQLAPEVDLAEKRRALLLVFTPYLGAGAAEQMADRCLAEAGLRERTKGTWLDLADLRGAAMRSLAGAIGSAAAAHAIGGSGLVGPHEQLAIDRVHREIVAQIDAAPEALRERIAEHKARAEQMQEQASLLEKAVAEQTRELRDANLALASARDAAESANRTKSAFLANMSHEIRTPMTAILGFTEMLASDVKDIELPTDVRDWIATVHRNADHLVVLMNDILDLSKLEAGKMVVERIPVDAAALVRECVEVMRPRSQEKGLALSLHVERAVPPLVTTDPVRLRQLVTNLLSNAVKFTERGDVRVRVDWRQDDTGPMLHVEVADTGIGMTPETVARLFQPFEQGDSSMSRRFGGSGLGLSICARLATLLGGNIRCTSQPMVGSVFALQVAAPIAGAAIAQDGLVVEHQAEKDPLRGVRVLVVDDGPDNRKLVAHILRRAGADVETAEHGQQGLELALAAQAAGRPFDVVIMDMQMPVMDGYAATRALRAARYTRPILALTAHAMASERAPCIAAGCDDYLSKPVERGRLVDCVAHHARTVVQV